MSVPACDKTLMTVHKCLHQVSERAVKSIQIYTWGQANGLDLTTYTGLNAALKQSACLECLSKKQLDDALTAIDLNKFAPGTNTVTAFGKMVDARELPDHRQQALLVYLKCLYWQTH